VITTTTRLSRARGIDSKGDEGVRSDRAQHREWRWPRPWLQRAGRMGEALRALEEGSLASPRSLQLRLAQARLLEQAGEMSAAVAAYEKAAGIEPTSVEAWTQLGRLHFQARRYPRAVESYERALAVDPTSWRHAADLAQILTFVPGGRPRAVQVIQAALGYHPDEPELLRVLQVVHQRP
jgi:tetratricopeptide (TPR) repeat protein